jgi:hypothetical protein
MDTDTWIWIIVAAVVVLALLAVAAVAMRKKQQIKAEQRRVHADELRHQATATTPNVTEAQLRAEEADAQASLARTEAQRADEQAALERQRLAAEEAQREDLVREADRLDPDVDHTADGYAPGEARPTDDGGPTHRA